MLSFFCMSALFLCFVFTMVKKVGPQGRPVSVWQEGPVACRGLELLATTSAARSMPSAWLRVGCQHPGRRLAPSWSTRRAAAATGRGTTPSSALAASAASAARRQREGLAPGTNASRCRSEAPSRCSAQGLGHEFLCMTRRPNSHERKGCAPCVFITHSLHPQQRSSPPLTSTHSPIPNDTQHPSTNQPPVIDNAGDALAHVYDMAELLRAALGGAAGQRVFCGNWGMRVGCVWGRSAGGCECGVGSGEV